MINLKHNSVYISNQLLFPNFSIVNQSRGLYVCSGSKGVALPLSLELHKKLLFWYHITYYLLHSKKCQIYYHCQGFFHLGWKGEALDPAHSSAPVEIQRSIKLRDVI